MRRGVVQLRPSRPGTVIKLILSAMVHGMEGFKKYIHKGRSYTPKVGIRKNGQIQFNSGAVQKYSLDVYKYAMLFISNDNKRVAIRFTNNEKESGLFPIQKRAGSFCFSARTFLGLYEINRDETENFNFLWIERDKTAIFRPDGTDINPD